MDDGIVRCIGSRLMTAIKIWQKNERNKQYVTEIKLYAPGSWDPGAYCTPKAKAEQTCL